MIYPSEFESKIGFDTLRALLIEKCSCTSGKEHAEKMSFSGRAEEVKKKLQQTHEMVKIKEGGTALPVETIYDIEGWLTELRSEGSYLNAQSLQRLGMMLDTLTQLGKYFSGNKEIETPALDSLFGSLRGFPHIVSEISRCIDRYGEVKDNASEGLSEVRRSIRRATGSMQSAMRSVMERAKGAGLISSDAQPSIRDGRMVIAVSADKKRQLGGIIHDESATGKTVYIEPSEVVEASNRLKELTLEEHREIVAVLMSIAATIRPEIDLIAAEAKYLGILDFIRAKADVAIEIGGEMPVIEEKPEIDWYHAVHPVLLLALRKSRKEVVPLTLKLDHKERILIISGPNAGGKSVCLKTVGIIQYMTQCGMLPTMYSNSHVGIFGSMFADIGDEQSIENDLSTYSSHLRNMKMFLSHADKRSIILADEMGSGTEPQIGGALAQAILERLGGSGCYGVVTTHYQNLKRFADEAEGFVNGAMLYDRQHLQPTFQLSVGSPGSSFALEIARKTGMPFEVIEKAKEIVGSDYVSNDKYLLDIARDRRYWANKRQSVKEKENKLDALLAQYEEKTASLRKQRTDILNEARHEARELMKGANARIERTIRDIKTAEAEKERTRQVRKELDEYKSRLEKDATEADTRVPEALRPQKHKSKAYKGLRKEEQPIIKKELQVGDYVKMANGGITGKILSINGKKAEVAFGGLRTFVEISKLQPAQAPKPSALTQTTVIGGSTSDAMRERQLNFKQEIDVRGMRADEAVQAVTYFLDDAIQFGASRIRILHGTGHGILKTMIRQQLDINKSVRKYADEDIRFGGAGITVVDLE